MAYSVLPDGRKLKVSVALCTYNGERFLQEQLDSIANQTRLPDEVVVGDDGSTDNTLEILETWAKTTPFPVRIIRNPERLNVIYNFQETILRCTGEIVFLCDQDDVWLPEKIERMSVILELYDDCAYTICRTIEIDENSVPIQKRPKRNRFNLMEATAYSVASSTPAHAIAIRKSMVEKIFPIASGWPHDIWICTLSPIYGKKYITDMTLMMYRVHNTSLTYSSLENPLKYGKNMYYLLSTHQFLQNNFRRATLLEQLASFPECRFKNYIKLYYNTKERHYGRP